MRPNRLIRQEHISIINVSFILLFLLSSITLKAQTPMNFSGKWEFDKTKNSPDLADSKYDGIVPNQFTQTSSSISYRNIDIQKVSNDWETTDKIFNDTNNNTVTDVDGNIYTTVTIGTQVWMVENLKVTKYRNGDPIPIVTDNNLWNELKTDAYCNYDNSTTNVSTYGRLYNWYTVNDNRNLAPTGWHVPSDEEWATLSAYLGGNNVAGGKMKEPGTTHWLKPNPVADCSCGFKGLPGGIRTSYDKNNGVFAYIGQIGAFWSSTNRSESEAWMRFLTNYDKVLSSGELPTSKIFGYSVRCIKD